MSRKWKRPATVVLHEKQVRLLYHLLDQQLQKAQREIDRAAARGYQPPVAATKMQRRIDCIKQAIGRGLDANRQQQQPRPGDNGEQQCNS